MIHTKLIMIDGMPGSGKTTTGQLIADRLAELGIPNRFYKEMAENHPLRIYGRQFTTFTIEEEAEWFSAKVRELFQRFVDERSNTHEVTIMEAYLFQNTIGFGFNLGMDHTKLSQLANEIITILTPLDPTLIYYYQTNVERNWRWICEIRGPEFTQNRCGIYTDEDFVKAGEFWTANQNFVTPFVHEWSVPKLIIENNEYSWGQYKESVFHFLDI